MKMPGFFARAWNRVRGLSSATVAGAVAQALPFPEYGLTAVLDAATPRVPAGIEETAPALDAGGLSMAVDHCARLLSAQWARTAAAVSGVTDLPPQPLARWALKRLRPDPGHR